MHIINKTDKKVVNLQEVLAQLGISKSTLYRLIEAGRFPKPFKLGMRLNAWRVETIEYWLATQSDPLQDRGALSCK